VADSYEKRARAKRKQQRKREKAEQRRMRKEQDPADGPSEEDVAAQYVDRPNEEDD
jgi:hypothetical protein